MLGFSDFGNSNVYKDNKDNKDNNNKKNSKNKYGSKKVDTISPKMIIEKKVQSKSKRRVSVDEDIMPQVDSKTLEGIKLAISSDIEIKPTHSKIAKFGNKRRDQRQNNNRPRIVYDGINDLFD